MMIVNKKNPLTDDGWGHVSAEEARAIVQNGTKVITKEELAAEGTSYRGGGRDAPRTYEKGYDDGHYDGYATGYNRGFVDATAGYAYDLDE